VDIGVSEELPASMFRVEKALKMEAVGLFKMETTYETIQCHDLEDYSPSRMHDIIKRTLEKECFSSS
jgi:hypothetical protein